jgi:hypothetical protein
MRKQAPRRLPETARPRWEIVAAAAQENVTRLHVQRALELVERADGSVPATRMLDIYLRLQGLPSGTLASIRNRTLAALGGSGADGVRAVSGADRTEAAGDVATDAEQDAPTKRSVWRSVRRRLRGRVHAELRRLVELHAGVTQRQLLELHVRQAREFVELLGNEHPIEAGCDLYCELLNVPLPFAPLVYPLVLDAIAGEHLPRTWPVRPRTPRASETDEPTRAQERPRRMRPPA